MEIENQNVIDQFLKREASNLGPHKLVGNRTTCYLEGLKAIILGAFGLARFGDIPQIGDIQPDMCRAPEVIIEARCSYSVDIWNMASIVSNLDLSDRNAEPVLRLLGMVAG